MPKFLFSKLVRDKIIEHQIASGATPMYRRLTPDEHKKALVDKVIEEVHEVTASSKEDIAGEIADVQQAIDDLIELYGLTREDIIKEQTLKNSKNGSFKQGIYVEAIELDENDKWVQHYRNNADRYPEV